MSYTVYGVNVSPFVRKVRAYLGEKGLPYVLEPVNPFQPPPDYREISPLGKIPAFRDGERTLADSTAICVYVERCHPEPALYPSDPYAYARALWFEEYMDSGLLPVGGPQVFRPLALGPMMFNQPVTPAIKAEAMKVVETGLVPMWAYLEKELGDRPCFVGANLSIADISVATGHVMLWHVGVDPDPARFPKLSAFLARMYARPVLKAIMDEEAPTWNRRAQLAAIA
jgi:glutathione S-transferase